MRKKQAGQLFTSCRDELHVRGGQCPEVRRIVPDGDDRDEVGHRYGNPFVWHAEVWVDDTLQLARRLLWHEAGLVRRPGLAGEPVNLRDKTSSMASDLEEIEGTAFAASLLMPEQMIRDQLSQLPPARRREPDTTADALAKIFKVSTPALNFRLINLGLTS
jgi:IrrE N-terminal-like domain